MKARHSISAFHSWEDLPMITIKYGITQTFIAAGTHTDTEFHQRRKGQMWVDFHPVCVSKMFCRTAYFARRGLNLQVLMIPRHCCFSQSTTKQFWFWFSSGHSVCYADDTNCFDVFSVSFKICRGLALSSCHWQSQTQCNIGFAFTLFPHKPQESQQPDSCQIPRNEHNNRACPV